MDYFAHPAISNSKLGWFKRSPAHYKFFQDNKTKDSQAFLIGSASHCILFEPDKFKSIFYVLDEKQKPFPEQDYRNKANSIWKQDILEAYKHKQIITLDEYDKIMFMMDKLKQHDFVQELLKDCKFEQEVFWIDPETGLECKKKVDAECTNHRVDYKTTDNAEPIGWQKKAWSYDYYRQAGFYDLDVPKEFYFIVQEKEPPYEISVHRATRELIDYGKNEAIGLLKKIKVCKEKNFWAGYEANNYKPEAVGSEIYFYDFDIPMWKLQSM